MAGKPFEQDDPMELVGMVMPPGDDTMMEDMGRTFIDEFLRMGWPPHAIVGLFRDPFYRAPHSIFRSRGEDYVVALVESVHGARGAR
jgi:hypothetical protein